MRRRLSACVLLLGLAVLLSACSPPHIGTIGIQRNANGTLTALIRICTESVGKLIVHPVNSFPHAKDGSPLSDRWESVADVEVPLNPAVTESADVAFPMDEGALETNVLYELWAAGRQGNAFSGLFGASELAALKPGEVISDPMRGDAEADSVRDGGSGGVFMTVTREQFEQRAEAYCG